MADGGCDACESGAVVTTPQQTLALDLPSGRRGHGSLPRMVDRPFWDGEKHRKSLGASPDHRHLPRMPKLSWGKARCEVCGYATTAVPGKRVLCGACEPSTANAQIMDAAPRSVSECNQAGNGAAFPASDGWASDAPETQHKE